MHLDRRTIRYVGAVLAATMAAIYYLVGIGVLDVVAGAGDPEFLIVFGGMAGSAFLLGAILLVATDRRWLWIIGAAFQVFVIWAYVDIAKQRTPPFETWGIALRILQVPLLACLAWLAWRPASRGAPAAITRARGERRG